MHVVPSIARAGRTEAAFEFADRMKARELLDGMARREALRNPAADRPQAREAALASVHTRAVTLALPPADSLVDPVRRLVLAMQAKGDIRTQARLLGMAIVAPIASAMPAGVSRLVIVPSAPLNTLPFDVLELPEGRRVIERFEVSYAPSASVYAALRRRAIEAPPRSVTRGVLAFGAPDRPRRSGVAGWDTLPPLPSAAAEARDVGRT